MKGYANLGSSAGELLGAFLNKDVYRQKGYDETLPKVMQARYYDAKTEGDLLDNAQKRKSQAITADDLVRAMGVPDDIIGRVRGGDIDQYGDAGPQIPIDAGTVDKVRRGDVAHTAFEMGGGNVDQILGALLKGQRMNAQDMVMSGEYEAPDVGRAAAAVEGKALYNDGTSGILDIFTGGVTPTARSRAATDADVALAEQRRTEKETGSKDPDRIKMIKYLESRGFDPDSALRIAMMDSTPEEMHAQTFRTALSSTMGSQSAAKKIADEYMAFLLGPNWQRSFSVGGGPAPDPPPATLVPAGWSVEVEP